MIVALGQARHGDGAHESGAGDEHRDTSAVVGVTQNGIQTSAERQSSLARGPRDQRVTDVVSADKIAIKLMMEVGDAKMAIDY